MEDQEFAKSREALSARKRDLVVHYAKGNHPQAARELTEDEQDLLFRSSPAHGVVDAVFAFWVKSERRVFKTAVG